MMEEPFFMEDQFATRTFSESAVHAVSQIFRKVLLGAPLGCLLVLTLSAWQSRLVRTSWNLVAWGVLVSFAWATFIEVLQAWMHPHVTDFTDAFICTIGATLGLAAARVRQSLLCTEP
jgi:glycopeptide antibiotics resistance protein